MRASSLSDEAERMLPIGDFNPRRHVPVVTILLVAANLIVFVYQLLLPEEALNRLLLTAAMIPLRVTHYLDAGAAMSLVTSMFMHGGWMHVLGNMLYLWIFGDNVEDALGTGRYLLFYLAAGIIAGLAQVAINPTSDIPTLGASGAVAGVLGAYLVLYPRQRVRTVVFLGVFVRVIELPALVLLGFWFLLQLVNGLASVATMSSGGVAWFAHLGGFVAGLLVGLMARPRLRTQWT
jgi:membrane associated rhomboid family serine protease